MAAKSQHSATIEPNLVELPPCIEIKDSSVNSGVPGAFSKMLIPQDTRFGPYKGEIILPGQKAFIDFRFAWEVFEKNSNVLKHTINAMDSRSSNWMRHVNNARFYEEQNIISTQDGYSIYYVAMKDIKPGEELLTWFDPKLLKRTKRRLSKMARKPVGYTIELVPWSDEKKFVPEIIETKRARKKKVLSDMISLDENPLILTRTLQRLSKLPCTPKQLAQSGYRGTATSEHKNIGLEASKSTSFGSTYIFPSSKTMSMHKGPVMVKGSPAKKDHGSFQILGHNTKSMHHDPNRGRVVQSNNSVCFTMGNARSEKGNAQLSAANITGSFLKIKKMKGKGNVELRKSPIRIGKFNHQNMLGGGVLVYEDFAAIKPIVFTPNSDGSTSVEDHDETFILGNIELMPECDEKCFCLVDKTPTSSIEAKQGNFVIQFTLLPEHKSISPDNKIIFRCDICDSAYNHAFSLKRHYLRVHVNHRYLSREDIVNCQIETFHTNFELESRDLKLETLASSEENIQAEEQLSIPKISLSDLDQISTDTPIRCIDKLEGKSIIQDNSLVGEVPICRDGNKESFGSEVNAIDSSSELTAVPSLSNLAQASLDKAKVAHAAVDIPSKLSTTACEQIKHHSSVVDNGSQGKGDESLTSDQQPSLGLETLSAQLNNDNLIADISWDGHTEMGTVNDLIQHSLKPDLMAAALDEGVASQSMEDVCNSMKMHDEHSTAESVPQRAICEEVQAASIDTNCSAEILKTRPIINPDVSDKWCTSASSFTEEISLVSAEPYVESAVSTSDLFKLSPDEFDHNRLLEETNEASENSCDQVCQTLSADSILDENIDQNDFEEERMCSPLNDTDIVPCSSTESIKNDAEDFLEQIESCSATSLTESSPADSNNGISVENDTDGSGIKVDASYTISDVDFLNSESITSPMESSQSLQEEVGTQMLTTAEHTDFDHSVINAVTPVALFANENNRDNLSDLAMGSFGSLSPFINQLSPLTCDAKASNVYKNLQVSPQPSGAHELSKKYDTDNNLPETSALQNTAAFPVSTLESSTTPSITSTSPVTSPNQPPQQLIFVTNLVFPVVSPGQKQIPNSMTPLSLAVSQSSSPTTSQTTMPGLTTSVPLVVISQVPCGLSVQNAANAFLQSSSALKTLQSIKHSLNVLNLGSTAPGLRSLLPSSHKSSIATVACGNSALINSLTSKNSTAVTSSPIYSCSSKSEHISGNPLKPGTILNYSSPHTAVSSLVYGPQPISTIRSTKSVTVVKTLTPTMSSFITPQRTQAQSGAQPDDLYRCHMCVLVFKTMTELKFHIRNDPHRFKGGIKQYACLQCSMRFSNKNNLMRHNLMNHPENENFKFRCYTCGKGFMSETYLKMHARFHSGKNFPCKYGCVDKFFPNAASLVKHLRAQHAGLDLKEYLRNEKASRKKVSGIFTVTNGQISSLKTEEKSALVTNKPVVTSLVQYSLSQPGIGFQAKRGHSKGSKHPSNDFSELFSKVEDKFGNSKELEFLSKVSDSLVDGEQNNNLRYECHLCLQRLSSHLKLLQHRTRKHGMNQSVQEYLYQMSKETVDGEVSEAECVKLEFSPPPSPKTFFENVNRRGYENMNHYIDGSKESLDLWQKHLIGQESVTKCEHRPSSSSKEKLEWTMFNFPLCFEYKEDCTIFYDRMTELDGDRAPEGGKEKCRLSAMCEGSGVKIDAEKKTLDTKCDVSAVKMDTEKKTLDTMCDVSVVKIDTEKKTLDTMCDLSGVKIDAEKYTFDAVCDVSGINIDTEKKTLDAMCAGSGVKIDAEKNTLDAMCEGSGVKIEAEKKTLDAMCDVSGIKIDTEKKTLDTVCDVSAVNIDAEKKTLDMMCEGSEVKIGTEKKTLDVMCGGSGVKIDAEKKTFDAVCDVSGTNIDTEKKTLDVMCGGSGVKIDAEKKTFDAVCDVSGTNIDTEKKTLDAMCDVSGINIDTEMNTLDVVCDVSGINIDTEKNTFDVVCDVSGINIDTEKKTLDVVCDVSGINIDTEMNTVDEALECMKRTSDELFNECTNDVIAIDRQEFPEKNSTDSCEESLCVDRKSHDKLTSENQKTITREVDNNSDTVVDVDNCKVIDKTMIVTEELSKNSVYSYDNLVETNESNLDCSIADDYVIKSGASIHTSSEEITNTTKREIQCLCRCIVQEIVDSALMASKGVMEMEHNLHEVQSVCCEVNEVRTFLSEGVDGPLETSEDSVLDSDVVPNTHDAKVDENMDENNLVTALNKAPITYEALSKTKLQQQQFTKLSAEEKCEVLKGHSVQGIDLAISGLDHMTSLSDTTLRKEKLFLDRMHPSSVLLLDALDLHIAEKPRSSKLFKKILCSKMENASWFMSSIDKTIEPPMVSSETKMSYAHFDQAEGACLNTSDASKHDHKRYSIWAGQVQQSFHKTNKEETFCQPVTEAVRKQELMRQQVQYQFDKSERFKEIDHKSEPALKMNFAEDLGLMSKKEFDLSYHTKKQQEFVIKVPEIWDNYENIWFGKKGNITVVCSICHRHFSCWDLCFRHQLKKHPHIEPASLEMERDNYVEDMYYYYPMPYGILAQTHLIPDNLQALEVYVCTKCGFPFKNLSRLHAHIIVCGPAQEGTTSSQNGHLKKPSYMKKKLLPIMDRRLYQNLEQPKAKVRQAVKNVVYARSPSAETKHSASSLAQEKGNKLSLTPDSKLSSSSLQSRSNYFTPFSFYSGRKRKTYELLYNPQNHTRRREMYKVLEQHQCHGCNLKFNSLYMLEKHVNKCDGRDKLQSQKPLLSGIMPDDAAVRKQHTCRYCSKRFTHIKGVDLHYKRICAVRKVKEEENQLTAEDLAHEAELLRIIEHIKWSKSLNKDSSDIIQGNVIVEEDGTLTRVVKQQGSPQGSKKKVKKKTSKWTTLKRHRLDEDMSTPSSSTQSSPVVPADGDMKLSEQVGGILGASGQKRLTRSMSHEVVNKKPVATKRQISAGGGSVRNKEKTVSPSSSTGNSRTTSATSTQSKNKSKAKKSSSSKVNTSGNGQNKSHSKSVRDSRENTNEACSSSGTSLKPCKEAAPTNPSACIKPPARKRGKPQKFDPSDMESSYKKPKKSDQVYTFSHKKPDFHERKRSRSEASSEESSQKKQKTEVTVKVCESYLLRNKSPRVVLERTTAPYTGVSKCDLSRKDDKPDSKKISNCESSKLVVKMKQFTETTKSKRSTFSEVTKPSSSLARGDMLNNKERKQIISSKKVSVDQTKCKSIGKVPSSELLKHLTEDDGAMTLNKPSQKSVAKRKKPATPLQAQSLASLKDKCASSKRLKITTLKSGGKTSSGTSSPISKAPMSMTSNSPVISGLRTLAKTTLGKATLRLEGGESRNNVIKSSLVTLPVMSSCSVVTSTSSVTSSSQSCKGILSKPTSPVFKQSTAPVRIVTLSPNGNNLLTYDSPEDVPHSSLLLPKSTNTIHVSLPSPTVSLSPRTVLVSTKSAVNVQPKEFLKIIHDPNREKHAAPNSESSGFIHIGHGQTKSTIRMKESVIHVTSHSSASHKGPLSPASGCLDKLGQASQEGEQEDMVYSIEKLKSDSKSEDELVGKGAVGNCPTNNYSVTLKNVSVPAVLNSIEGISTDCSEEKTPKLSVKRSLNLSLDNEIIPQGITEQVFRKETCTTSKAVVDRTPDKQNQIIANCIPRASTAQHITYCQNGQNIVQQKAKLVHSVNSLGFLSSHTTPTQSTSQPKFRVTSASAKSHEAVSAIIIPSTAIKTQITVPRVPSSTSASSLTFPTRFGSPAKIITVTGGAIPTLIQGGTVQTGNRILKLGSPRSFMAPTQTTSIRASCQQIPSAATSSSSSSHATGTTLTKMVLPLSAAHLPKIVTTGIRQHHPQPAASKTTGVHSLLNIAANQTNTTTHLISRPPAHQLCVPQSTIINNIVTVPQPSGLASFVPASSIKTNQPPRTISAVPFSKPATNQIMFSLDDGTTAMLDPDSLAQLLSISPSLNKTQCCSSPSVVNGASVDKSAGLLDVPEGQLSESGGDAITWPSNGTVDLTDLSDSGNFE